MKSEINSGKVVLRKHIAELKRRYTPEELMDMSREVLSVLEITGKFGDARKICIYNAMKGEVETRFFVDKWMHGKEFYFLRLGIPYREIDFDYPLFDFDTFNWFGFDIGYGRGFNYYTGSSGRMLRSSVTMENMIYDESDFADAVVPVYALSGEGTNALGKSTMQFTPPVITENEAVFSDAGEVQIRQNLNETAFFYPQLRTNEAGETLIAFTVPESNTTWKLMGLAHTKDLKYGQIIQEAVSQKQLMVAPNVPRFIREGDKMTILLR